MLLARDWLPPAYRFGNGWEGEIAAAVVLPGPDGAERIAVATRKGLFMASGGGWTLLRAGNFWGARRSGDVLLAFGVIAARCDSLTAPLPICRAAPDAGMHMVSDADVTRDGATTWVGHLGLHGAGHESDPQGRLPRSEGVPWQFVINQIHRAAIPAGPLGGIVTDIAAIAACLLSISGVVNLLRQTRRKRRRR